MQQASRRSVEGLSPEGLMIFTGNANPKLAADVASHLHIPLGKATVGRFSDGEVMVEIMENVRGKDVFVLQSTCAPTNDHLMEVLVMVDALNVRRLDVSPRRCLILAMRGRIAECARPEWRSAPRWSRTCCRLPAWIAC